MNIKFLYLTLSILSITWISSCGDDVQDPLLSSPLKGAIDGDEWDYTVGKALFNPANQTYIVTLFNIENVNDGCTLFGGNNAYIDFEIPLSVQTVNQPSGIYQSLTFYHPNSQDAFTATSGYIEIILVNNFEIRGIINSRFDDENYVEGIFSAILCN